MVEPNKAQEIENRLAKPKKKMRYAGGMPYSEEEDFKNDVEKMKSWNTYQNPFNLDKVKHIYCIEEITGRQGGKIKGAWDKCSIHLESGKIQTFDGVVNILTSSHELAKLTTDDGLFHLEFKDPQNVTLYHQKMKEGDIGFVQDLSTDAMKKVNTLPKEERELVGPDLKSRSNYVRQFLTTGEIPDLDLPSDDPKLHGKEYKNRKQLLEEETNGKP